LGGSTKRGAEHVAGRPPTILPHAEQGVVEAPDGRVRVDLRRVPVDVPAMVAALETWDSPLRDWTLAQHRGPAAHS
jgi:hypothetical protein